MEELTIILGIVILVFGILQIILFFKLWGMTNDVKAIKMSLCKEEFCPQISSKKDQVSEMLYGTRAAIAIILILFIIGVILYI